MNIHVGTLEYARDLERAGIAREHAEAIAKLQAKSVTDLVEHELVTKDYLHSELVQLEARLESKLREEFRNEATTIRRELSSESQSIRRQIDQLMVQIRALQFGGAIAAFALGAVVLIARLLR